MFSTQVSIVIFDRDGTLIDNVPYASAKNEVTIRPGVNEGLMLLRSHQIPMAVATNQSGIGRGLITLTDVRAINKKIESLVGQIGPWYICPHSPSYGCKCRKPLPGLVTSALSHARANPKFATIIGDRLSDIQAGTFAKTNSILVPSADTPKNEITQAPYVASSISEAVAMVLAGDSKVN